MAFRIEVEIRDLHILVKAITDLQGGVMAAIDDFNQAVQDFGAVLSADLKKLSDSISAEIARVTAALRQSNDPAITAATESLKAMQANLDSGIQAAVNALDNELPSPPPQP